ncbi:MAG: Gfo/Idh/MocA family oxidoreductase [Alphaproteobacteria bacterium]|nr:MAG: Gfo/Idh/MocA family oxidoreductase [Alphaproteobacteria bacterium]
MSNVRIAQVGCGHWGKNLARNFAQIGVLAAVSDHHPATAAKIAAEHGVAARSFDEILADDSIQGVALATPAEMHADMALAAIAAGKHVYVEKPLALDTADAQQMIDAAAKGARVLMVGHLLQYHPIFLKLKEMVEAGELGKVRYVYSNRLSLGKFRTEENVLWSFAPHDISMILALTGEAPTYVAAEGAAYVTPGLADWAICHLRFPSGARGHVQASWLHPYKEHRLVVVGDKAMAVFEDSIPDWNKRLAIYRHGVDYSGPAPVPVKGDAEYVDVPNGEPLRSECQHFADCVASGASARTDGEEGLRVLEVLQRAEADLAKSVEQDVK